MWKNVKKQAERHRNRAVFKNSFTFVGVCVIFLIQQGMKSIQYYILVSFFTILLLLDAKTSGREFSNVTVSNTASLTPDSKLEASIQNLYKNINAKAYELNYNAFHYAMLGYATMKAQKALKNEEILTIIDFTKNSCQKRFYTINLATQEIVYNTWVSHGKKSGNKDCTRFSDIPESHQSSIGFYTTGRSYMGKHGESLRLHGNEQGYNANAYKRAVVIHGAEYVSEGFIKSNGRLGRSLGCPALPMGIHKQVINTIKDGSLVFAYYNDTDYLRRSKYLKKNHAVLLAQL